MEGVSEADHQALRRQQRALAEATEDAEATGPARERAIEAANHWREQHGLPPLRDETERPELAFHELARARGLVRRVR